MYLVGESMVSYLRVCVFPLLAAGLMFLTACSTDEVNGSNPTLPTANTSAQLRAGDSLTVSVQSVPEPNINSVQIDGEGFISLPYIGTVVAAGATTGELAQRIRQTYIDGDIYLALDVSVTVTERYVYVGGEVSRPGRILWTPNLTLTKAIQSAGGFTLYAKESRVTIARDQEAYDINVTLAQKNPAQDVLLMPGDSIQVPRSPF
jgi:protein involved in polysaccharide export with SLBB domain